MKVRQLEMRRFTFSRKIPNVTSQQMVLRLHSSMLWLKITKHCGKLGEIISPSLAPTAAGQVTTASAIVVRSAGDEEKEITAKICQAKFTLYHVGGIWDFLAGEASNIAHPVWPKTVQDILAMARTSRAGQLLSLLI